MTNEELEKTKLSARIFWLKQCIEEAEQRLQDLELIEEFKQFKTNSETSRKCTQTLIENLKKDLERRKIAQDASTAHEN